MVNSRLWVAGVIVAAVFVGEPDRTIAQDRAAATREDAVLAVDGVVREVFQSERQDRVDYIVQIEVKRSESLRARGIRCACRARPRRHGLRSHVATARRRPRLGQIGPRPTSGALRRRSDRPGRTSPGASLSLPRSKRGLGRCRRRLVRVDVEEPWPKLSG